MTLEEVTKLLSELRIPISLVFTPINLLEEKKKFFASDTYEPQFSYRIVKNRNEEIFSKLSSISEISNVDPRISRFYLELIEAKKDASKLMHSVGNNEIVTEISVSKYNKPSSKLFRNACLVLKGNMAKYNAVDPKKINRAEMLGYEEIENIFLEVFKTLGLNDWTFAKSKNIAKNGVKIGVKRKQVLVDPNIVRSKFKLKKTLVHEVGTHVLRAYNGLNSGFDALSNANLPEYLDVEEGLATWNESDMGLLTTNWLKKKAALVWAIYIGEELSFRQLYNAVLAVLPKYAAFDITYRVKRGLGDTSYPGIYAKDVVYFRGLRKVMKRLENDSSLYEKLYAGKINFKQTVWVDEGLIPKATIVPSKDMWKKVFKEVGL